MNYNILLIYQIIIIFNVDKNIMIMFRNYEFRLYV